MARPTKYKKKYARELMSGIRYYEGLSIEKLCWRWGITTATYNRWRNEYTSFQEACEYGDRDFKIYWYEKVEQGVDQGKAANGALLKFVATNVLGWSDKKEVKHEGQQQRIGTINITMLEPHKDIASLPDNSNVIDITDDIKNNQSSSK